MSDESVVLNRLTELVMESYALSSPAEINRGWCFVWAWIAHRIFPRSQLIYGSGHACIRLDGKFYDSEATSGVDNIEGLPTVNGCSFSAVQTKKEFYLNWTHYVSSPNRSFLKDQNRLLEIEGGVWGIILQLPPPR